MSSGHCWLVAQTPPFFYSVHLMYIDTILDCVEEANSHLRQGAASRLSGGSSSREDEIYERELEDHSSFYQF